MKKTLKTIFIAMLIGILLSSYIFMEYKNKSTVSAKTKTIYLLQYGAYKSKDNMEESCKNIKNYFYYKENDLYHVLIGITLNKNLKDKIINAYEITSEIYLKEITLSQNEFIEDLEKYDKLIKTTTDNEVIINAEKQILNKYEEIIINDESIN